MRELRTESKGLMTAEDLVQIAPNISVQKNVLAVIERIRNYDPNLDVMYLDPSRFDTTPFDAPWVVVERCNDGKTRLVLSVWEMNDLVFQRVAAADTWNIDVQAKLDKVNEAARKEIERKRLESFGDAKDLLVHAMRAPTSYKFKNHNNELVTLEDDVGIVKRKATDDSA